MIRKPGEDLRTTYDETAVQSFPDHFAFILVFATSQKLPSTKIFLSQFPCFLIIFSTNILTFYTFVLN